MRGYKFTTKIPLIYILILFSVFHNSCRDVNPDEINPTMTVQNERELGDRLYEVVTAQSNYLSPNDYPQLYGYLTTVTSMVKTQTKIINEFDWEPIVLEDNELNAYMLPGGKFVITSEMLKFIESGHQLFSLMAHDSYYVDRENQNSRYNLSIIMEKLKDKVNEEGYGTSIFIDMINGSDVMLNEVLGYLSKMSYNAELVFEADEYTSQMICENFLFSPQGTQEILFKAANQAQGYKINWLENRPPCQAVDATAPYSFNDRKNTLNDLAAYCGDNNVVTNQTQYIDVISTLP